MWFPFAADLPCLHCEAVQSTWSYMSVMCLTFLGFASAARWLFTRISFFLDSVFPFSALFGPVYCSHLVFTVGQQLPEATGLILTWPRLSAGLPFGLAQSPPMPASSHFSAQRHAIALKSNNLQCSMLENLSVGVWRLLEQQPTWSDKTQPPSLLSFSDQHPTGMPKQFPLQVATPPSGRLPQCNGENKISLVWFIKVAFYDHHHNWNLRCFWNRTKYSGWLNILLFIQHQAFAQQWMNTNSQVTYSANIKLEISIQISLAKHTEQSIKYNRVGLFSWAVLCGSCRLGKVRPGHDEWLMNSPPIATAVIEQNTEQNNNRIKTRKVINIQTHIWWWHWRRRRLTKRQIQR